MSKGLGHGKVPALGGKMKVEESQLFGVFKPQMWLGIVGDATVLIHDESQFRFSLNREGGFFSSALVIAGFCNPRCSFLPRLVWQTPCA